MQLLLSHEVEIPGASCASREELRLHMEERFARAVGRGQAVSALACEPLDLGRIEHRNPGLTPRVLGALVLGLEPPFRPSETVALLEEGCLVLLLVGADPQRMEAACREWAGGAKELAIDGLPGPLRLSLRIGYAVTQPGKRLFVDTLIRVARAGLVVARCRSAGACVHTMVYDVLQEGLERERGTEGIVVAASARLPAEVPARERGMEDTPLESAQAWPDVSAQTVRRGVHGGDARDPVVLPPAPGLAPRGSAPADAERRERELTEALDAQRRENDALRARLRALETRQDPHQPAARWTQETLAAGSASAQDMLRIDVLERRLAKVTHSLEEAERCLSRVPQAETVDSGLASRFRTVQGLEADAPDRALKVALLQKVFEANLELREHLRVQRRGFSSTEKAGLAPGL